MDRPETGTMQFGDDWPGVFIRGDNCGVYALELKQILDRGEICTSILPVNLITLYSLYNLLASSERCKLDDVENYMLPYEECRVENT